MTWIQLMQDYIQSIVYVQPRNGKRALYFACYNRHTMHWDVALNLSQLAEWKSTFLTCPWHKIYRVEAVGRKCSNYTLKNYDFCENVKFGAICENGIVNNYLKGHWTSMTFIFLYLILKKINDTTCVQFYTSCVIFLTQQLVGSYVSQCCVTF